MNHINTIEIKNFKSIRHQKIEDCRRVNVFIGYPNVGKSNILEALSFLAFINTPRPVGLKNLIRFENFSQIFHYSKFNDGSKLIFNNRYDLHIEYSNEEYLRLFLTDTLNPRFGTSNPYIIGLRIGRGFIDNPTVGDAKIDEFTRYIEGLEDFFVKPYKYLSNQKFSYAHSVKSLDIPGGYNLYEVIINNFSLLDKISQVARSSNIVLVVDQSTREIRFDIGKSSDILYTLPSTMLADTLVRLIFHKTAILSNKESVLLFEEPEAHMFPPYISKLTSDIVNDENNNQFFLTTHSPFVLNDLISNVEKDELSVYIVSYENETGETLIHRMNEDDVNEAYQFGYDFFMNINNFIPQKKHEQV